MLVNYYAYDLQMHPNYIGGTGAFTILFIENISQINKSLCDSYSLDFLAIPPPDAT